MPPIGVNYRTGIPPDKRVADCGPRGTEGLLLPVSGALNSAAYALQGESDGENLGDEA